MDYCLLNRHDERLGFYVNDSEPYRQTLNGISLHHGQSAKPLRCRLILQEHKQEPMSVSGIIVESRVQLRAAKEDLKESWSCEQNPDRAKDGEP